MDCGFHFGVGCNGVPCFLHDFTQTDTHTCKLWSHSFLYYLLSEMSIDILAVTVGFYQLRQGSDVCRLLKTSFIRFAATAIEYFNGTGAPVLQLWISNTGRIYLTRLQAIFVKIQCLQQKRLNESSYALILFSITRICGYRDKFVFALSSPSEVRGSMLLSRAQE